MDELSREYRVLYVEQNPSKEIVKERLLATVVDSLDSLSEVVCAQLQSIAESYPHLNALTGNQANQQLMQAQNVIQEAGRVYGQQLASTLAQGLNSLNILPTATAGSVASNQPTADVSISGTQAQVNASINQINDANEDSDDEEMSVKRENKSDDECLLDSDSQPDVEVKEEPEETQTETEINQTGDTATVKDEIVSSSDCESDTDSDDYESDTMQVKEEEDEIRFVHNSINQGPVHDGSSNEESENNAQSDGNVETVNSNEGNNEHQSDEMMMDDEENAAEESQDEPTITVVNYEVEMQFLDNSNNQNSLAYGSFNEDDNDHSPRQEVLDEQENSTEASSEQDQAGLSTVSNPKSILTRRSARASTARKVNYSEAIENSVTEQKDTLQTETCKLKRKTGRSGKSNAPKRSRVDPASTVAAPEVDYVSEDEEEDDPEAEAISLHVIVRLNCHVPGCKKVFPGKVLLDVHHLSKHAIEKYACKVKDCTESYATWGQLKAHRNSAHDNLDNEWPCGECEVTCPSYQKLREHSYVCHEYGLFACSTDRCAFTEKTRIKVQNHQAKHRPAKYHCTFAGCSSSFNQKSRLTLHRRKHTKEQPFLCSQCPKAFTQRINLTRHERIHSGLKPYSCTWPHCDYSSNQQTNVIYHVRGVHFGLPQTKTEQAKRGIIDHRDARLFVKKTATGN